MPLAYSKHAWIGIAVRLLFQPLPALCNLRVKQFDTSGKNTGISSSSQKLSPRWKSGAGFLNQTKHCQAICC
jgi:hypothetical protein